MKKYILLLSALLYLPVLSGQMEPNKHQAEFALGEGLNFSFQDQAYQFKIGGMMQPAIRLEQREDSEAELFMNSRRTYLNFSGSAHDEKLSFFMQVDFSRPSPLMDVWLAFEPWENYRITVGQKQNVGNNREMLIMEDQLQFPGRSLLSTSLSNTGRELGVFLEAIWGSPTFLIKPQVSVTSGDGRNSFGNDSRDVDLGGLKYSGRLDLLPFGAFEEGNLKTLADLEHQKKFKMVIGLAGSYNDGASDAVGEGHGDFTLYNGLGETQLPDYRQWFADLLMKYQGFSLLAEYGIASATSLEGLYRNPSVEDPLLATQIGEYLALGRGYNAQLGYVTRSGYGFDLRMASLQNEFALNGGTMLSNSKAYSFGFTRYLKEHKLKIQTMVGLRTFADQRPQEITGGLLVQLIF